MANEKKKLGRQTTFTPELGLKICIELANGKSLRKTCEMKGMPNIGTVLDWLKPSEVPEKEAFRQQYAHAREVQGECAADKINEIAEMVIKGDIKPDAGRVAIDAHKWTASKMAAKRYGDKITAEVTGKDGAPLVTEAPVETLAKAVALLGAKVEHGNGE